MREPVMMEQDDVQVLNRPASSQKYQSIHPQPAANGDEDL